MFTLNFVIFTHSNDPLLSLCGYNSHPSPSIWMFFWLLSRSSYTLLLVTSLNIVQFPKLFVFYGSISLRCSFRYFFSWFCKQLILFPQGPLKPLSFSSNWPLVHIPKLPIYTHLPYPCLPPPPFKVLGLVLPSVLPRPSPFVFHYPFVNSILNPITPQH